MPFYFRKSITIGGIRLNFSKSGVSYSASPIKGFRITTGKRGTYATAGSHGFYYRERLDKPIGQKSQPSSPPRQGPNANFAGDEAPPPRDGDAIPTADVSSFVDATSERIIREINSRKSTPRTAPILGIVCGLCSLVLLGCEFPILGLIAVIVTAAVTILAANHDKTQRTTLLHYDLDKEHSRYVERQRICQILAQSMKVWRVHSRESHSDWKRQAGTSHIIGRKEALVGKAKPPCIATNIDVWSIDAGETRLFFFPDYLFVLQDGRYGAVPYESLTAQFALTRFVEDSFVPKDASIVDYVWQYVRKDGGPDRRFSNNRQRPVAMYGVLVLTSSSGLNLHFQCSNQEIAKRVAEEIDQYKPQTSEQPQPQRPQAESYFKPAQPTKTTAKSDCEVLEVPINATDEDITASYIRLAQMYHPDKVENLAPEYKQIAITRMKEINDAYGRLKARRQHR